ncbi:molybdenum cofactor guanylyltransferase [Aliiglaciecola sp. LCG003]|uniref:molybdenum cofactor guanylyltransferase n=1 Tax=Aliiglaciecola sp. LCG003 TaxID=3053655 RepID=UPI00257436FC|nr:molybdenum cofactor guanylyltransferase [Aliiglaciecola sp. LCG003]WJG11126.1 molybdenum cofactor guanylyltransferase [Aliiglaciecola sp. LCG003]
MNQSHMTPPLANVLGLVMAGGQSSRMGQDKAALSKDGLTLLERAKLVLKRANVSEIIVSANDIDGACKDIVPNKGPLGAIWSVLNHQIITNQSVMLIVPVDMPLLSPESLEYLYNKSLACQNTCYFEASFLPLCLVINDALYSKLEQSIQSEDRSLRALLHALGADKLVMPTWLAKGDEFFNLNTPEQWQRFSLEMQNNPEKRN